MTARAPSALPPNARAVLRSLVPVICPADAVPLADAIVDHVAAMIGVTPPAMQVGFAVGLRAYDLAALPRYLRPARALTGARAERHYASWERGMLRPQRELARGVNQLMSLACYEQPAMAERVGYRPAAWIVEVTRKRLSLYKADIDAHARALVAPDPLRPVAGKQVAHGGR
jgi:hypothetical protein